jgi:hypothetical protein
VSGQAGNGAKSYRDGHCGGKDEAGPGQAWRIGSKIVPPGEISR